VEPLDGVHGDIARAVGGEAVDFLAWLQLLCRHSLEVVGADRERITTRRLVELLKARHRVDKSFIGVVEGC